MAIDLLCLFLKSSKIEIKNVSKPLGLSKSKNLLNVTKKSPIPPNLLHIQKKEIADKPVLQDLGKIDDVLIKRKTISSLGTQKKADVVTQKKDGGESQRVQIKAAINLVFPKYSDDLKKYSDKRLLRQFQIPTIFKKVSEYTIAFREAMTEYIQLQMMQRALILYSKMEKLQLAKPYDFVVDVNQYNAVWIGEIEKQMRDAGLRIHLRAYLK